MIRELNISKRKPFNIELFNKRFSLSLKDEPLERLFNQTIKRLFDILFSICVLIVVLPTLFPIVALLVKINSKGPVFFKQLRSGRKNRDFYCYKFRTMHLNKDSDIVQAVAGDKRITKIGKFLRKTNLDEFPQFYNVLLGDMSVVGPRPHMIRHTEEYSKLIDRYMVRHAVKPGITGLAQIKGYRGETTDTRKMKKRVMCDVWYIENWNFIMDIYIVFKTLTNAIRGDKNAF